jgi:Domain of unknown function (DUF4145)
MEQSDNTSGPQEATIPVDTFIEIIKGFAELSAKLSGSWLSHHKMSHATVVVTAASILDVELKRCIKTKMRSLDKKTEKRLFRGYGPLSSFAAKIDLAYALDIIPPDIHAELNKIRDIRNDFAHTTQPLSLDREPVRPLFDSLNRPPNAKGSYPSVFMACVSEINDFLERYLFRMGVTENISERNRVQG